MERDGVPTSLSFDMESSGFAGSFFGEPGGEEIKRCEKSSKPRPSFFVCFIVVVLVYAYGAIQNALHNNLLRIGVSGFN